MLHLIKLCVGPRDLAGLAALQRDRLAREGAVRAWTRAAPRRAEELVEGGSLYWVVGGFLRARQRLLGLEPAVRADGTPCVALLLDPSLVPVIPRPVKAFQGWRYLAAEEAPADLAPEGAEPGGAADLPPALREALREACLL